MIGGAYFDERNEGRAPWATRRALGTDGRNEIWRGYSSSGAH